MENNLNFEVFLSLSPEKIILSVNQKTDNKLIFIDKLLIENNSKYIKLEELNFFLNKNIFKVEKIFESASYI